MPWLGAASMRVPAPTTCFPKRVQDSSNAEFSTITELDRGSTFALRRCTLYFCLGGQRSSKGNLPTQNLGFSWFYCDSMNGPSPLKDIWDTHLHSAGACVAGWWRAQGVDHGGEIGLGARVARAVHHLRGHRVPPGLPQRKLAVRLPRVCRSSFHIYTYISLSICLSI